MFQVPSISSMGSKIPPTGAYHLLHGERPCPGARPGEPRGTRLTGLQEPLQSSGGETATHLLGLPQNLNSHFLKTNSCNSSRSTSALLLAGPLLECCCIASSPWARQGGRQMFCMSCLARPGPAHRQTAEPDCSRKGSHHARLPFRLGSIRLPKTGWLLRSPRPARKTFGKLLRAAQQCEALQSQVKRPSCIQEAYRLCCF